MFLVVEVWRRPFVCSCPCGSLVGQMCSIWVEVSLHGCQPGVGLTLLSALLGTLVRAWRKVREFSPVEVGGRQVVCSCRRLMPTLCGASGVDNIDDVVTIWRAYMEVCGDMNDDRPSFCRCWRRQNMWVSFTYLEVSLGSVGISLARTLDWKFSPSESLGSELNHV
jgi:hypothetical protein